MRVVNAFCPSTCRFMKKHETRADTCLSCETVNTTDVVLRHRECSESNLHRLLLNNVRFMDLSSCKRQDLLSSTFAPAFAFFWKASSTVDDNTEVDRKANKRFFARPSSIEDADSTKSLLKPIDINPNPQLPPLCKDTLL